jgi:3-(3-hydroxy-phenyl)propionate hydroxylase
MTAPFATFSYVKSPDQDRQDPASHPVVVIGAGPVGLSVAIDLGQQGVPVLLLDDSDRIGEGSRAICFAKKTLEIFDRLGCGDGMVAKGVSWSRGRVFQREGELYSFDLLPEAGHKMPAFINLQQFYVEKMLVDRALGVRGLDLRWKNRVIGLEQGGEAALLTIETPDGAYRLKAEHVIACDGARSPMRGLLGLDFAGEVFEEQFLIADVKMHGDYPTERWFWFDPPFHPGGSALLHRQPDDVWRIDLQLPATADAEFEKQPEQVRPRIERMLGHHRFDLEWVSIYRFRCLRLAEFIHGRVIFAGDAAHQVSPFGARGANSGVQDAENVAWKLAAHLRGQAGPALLASYASERGEAADENIGHSTRSTDFIAPQSLAERVLRDAALALAGQHGFAKRMVNSGRLSAPTAYRESPLSTPDQERWTAGPPPGAPIPDARVTQPDGEPAFLSEQLPEGFVWLHAGTAPSTLPPGVTALAIGPRGLGDPAGDLAARFGLTGTGGYLLRPDRHVAARFSEAAAAPIAAAHRRALGHSG